MSRRKDYRKNQRALNLWNIGQVFLVLVLVSGVLAVSPPTSAQTSGEITIEPTSGPPGSQALVTGSFPSFGSYDWVTIWWEHVYDGRRLGGVTLRDDGTFAIPIRIPPEAALGSHQVLADVNAGYAQASTTFEVTAADRSAAYIYNSDLDTANAFKELLEANGVSSTLVKLDQVASTNLAPYDLILVGHDTGTSWDWYGSSAALGAIQNSGKAVMGLGLGGATLFYELDLSIGYNHTWLALDETQVYVPDDRHPLWNVPYDIYVPGDKLVTLYSTSSDTRAVYLPEPVGGVLPLGRQAENETHYPLIQEDSRYLLWGFYEGPAAMRSAGHDLFINAIYYLIWAFEVDTLILTDYDRMENLGYSNADVAALENDINDLLGQPASTSNMTAIHRDLTDDAPGDVPTDCAGWDGNEGDVTATNTCVGAIDDYIEDLKQSIYPNLYYVNIVGTSEIIPMKAREQDHLISAQEDNWGNALPGDPSYLRDLYSTPGASGWGHYLTDSIYGDLSYIADGWGADHELVPELAVGRLVETPAQISDLIATYLTGNAYFSRANRVSIASSDYVDGGTLAADDMGPGTDDALVLSSFDSNDVPPKLNAINDLVYFGGHGDYNSISTSAESFKAGDHASYGDTAALNDMPDAVIVTSGCHNGVSFGNQLYHAPDLGTTYSEFPEEFAIKKAGVYVGATGYTIISGTGASTDVTQVRHNEKLATYVIQHLDQDGNITAGEAFRRAINSYLADVGAIGTMERRVISITTLYGIPNYRGPIIFIPRPLPVEYWREFWWLDPPPYIDPGLFRYRVELQVLNWEIQMPGPGPEWYLQIPGAEYGGNAMEPLLPVFKAGVVLPLGSSCTQLEWDQAASESTSWVADAPMYVPETTEDPLRGTELALAPPEIEQLLSVQPYVPFSTTTTGGAGILAGLSMAPLQHDPKTLETTLWTRMVFSVTCQVGASTDGDGDGLPTYWEGSYRLDPNEAKGSDGADGNPDDDGLSNEREFDNQTDPLDPDTDNDGWTDGKEVEVGTDPLNPGSYPRYIYLPVSLKSP